MTSIRRSLLLATALGAGVSLAIAGFGGATPAQAAEKSVTIGIDLPLTGADAEGATRIKYGAEMAIDEANAAGGVAGYKIDMMTLNDATASAGQYDPAQAATNAKKFLADPHVVAAIGPEMSGAGKAMSPILSAGDLATVTPSSTNPDITDPKFAGQYRPAGKAIYFRTVTTDAFQGPNMANWMRDTLKMKSVYILDDSGAYGVGIANAYEGQAKKIGVKVLGHDQLNPKEADYTTALTKIKGMNPDAIYYGGVAGAGVKLVKQSYDVLPKTIRAGGDGVYGPEYLSAVGSPANEGLYATNASPHVVEDPAVQGWVAKFTKTYGTQPDDYALTAYDASLVIIDAIKRVAASGKEVNHSNVRDAIQSTKLKTMQGEVSFDENGDINSRVVSVFQIKHDPKYKDDDMIHQYKYIGVAPQTPAS
jgi:branched-chain amino acid transport system substrate-binding protein